MAAHPAESIPAQGLAAYLEFDGLARHSQAWEATAAYAMFHRTPAGAMTADVARQLIDRMLKALPGAKISGADVLALHDDLMNHGFTVALYADGPDRGSALVVLNGMGRKEARDRIDRLVASVAPAPGRAKGMAVTTTRFRDREFFLVKIGAAPKAADEPPARPYSETWWFEGDALILAAGPACDRDCDCGADPLPDRPDPGASLPLRVAAVLDTLDGKAPSAATHPGRRAALVEGNDIKGFDANGLFFVELSGLKSVASEIQAAFDDDDAPEPIAAVPSSRSGPPGAVALPIAPPPIALPEVAELFPESPFRKETPGGESTVDKDKEHEEAKPDPAVAQAALKLLPAAKKPARDPAALAQDLGLDGVTRIVGHWGFQGKALLTDVRLEAPAPRRGLLALLDQPAFRKDRLPPVPRAAGSFLIGSFDPGQSYDTVKPLIDKIDKFDELKELEDIIPGLTASDLLESAVYIVTHQRLREDLLAHLGPNWCLFATDPKEAKTSTPPPTLLVSVRDADAFWKVLDSTANRLSAFLRAELKDTLGDDAPAGAPELFALKRLPEPERGYRLVSPAGIIPWLGDELQPTVLLGKSSVAIAANPALARAALAAATATGPDAPWVPTGALAEAFACLPAELTSLSVGDTSDSFVPETVVCLPKLVQYVTNWYAVQAKDENGEPKASPGAQFLAALGIPQAAGFRLNFDPDQLPRSEDLRAQLFPSVLATTTDPGGLRFICREAMPFASAGPRFQYHSSTKKGEMLTISLRAFLIPSFYIEIKHNTREEGGEFTFGFKTSLSPDHGSED